MILLALGALIGCAAPSTDTAEGTRAPHTLIWRLTWDSSGVSWDGDGWRGTTQGGDEVRVTGGYLSSHRVQLGSCAVARGWSSLGAAWACETAVNGSTVDGTTLEPLGAPNDLAFGATWTDELFCGAEYTLAPAGPTTPAAVERDMDGLTLRLEVEIRRAGEADWTPRTLTSATTARAFGGLYDAAGAVTALDSAAEDATVTVSRPLGALIGSLDLDDPDDDAQGTAALRALLAQTTTTLDPSL